VSQPDRLFSGSCALALGCYWFIRKCQAVTTMASNKQYAFGSQRWTSIPFKNNPKTLFDMLVDILFSLSRCLEVAAT
jgi:hypothetical protein